jgi:hypothetical protein
MKRSSTNVARRSASCLLACCLVLSCIPAFAHDLHLFDPTPQPIDLFQSEPMIATELFQPVYSYDLFAPTPANESAASVSLFPVASSNATNETNKTDGTKAPSVSSASSVSKPSQVSICLKSICDSLARIPHSEVSHAVLCVDDDQRPTIEAYSIEGCKPCRDTETGVGTGDKRYRVRWHHHENGEGHPWHIHEFAQKVGYPVFHYADPDGIWKRTNGRMSADDLACLVGRGDSKMVKR